MGLYKKDGKYYGHISRRGARALKKLCARFSLRFSYDNPFGQRDGKYRRVFFTHNPPVFGKYYCAYCGKRLSAEKLEVDHLYPVGAVSKDLRLQKKLMRRGFSSINDKDNLVASCHDCNKNKGAKLGTWIKKGQRGRRRWYWPLKRTVRRLVILALIAVLIGAVIHIQTRGFEGRLISPMFLKRFKEVLDL